MRRMKRKRKILKMMRRREREEEEEVKTLFFPCFYIESCDFHIISIHLCYL